MFIQYLVDDGANDADDEMSVRMGRFMRDYPSSFTIPTVRVFQNGVLSGLPYLGKYIMALSTGFIADWLKRSGKLSTTAIRKIFTTMAVGTPGILMCSLVYLGQTSVGVVSIMTLALTFNGAVTAGYLGNGLDIAPNFSGTSIAFTFLQYTVSEARIT